MLNKITNVSFTGKIIDVHTHTGHWDKPTYGKADGAEPYTIGDIFEKANRVKEGGDEISKILVSNLDCIKEENGKPILDEISGNKILLEQCQTNGKTAPLAVCQPKTGDVKNIKKLFKENPNAFVGLKFHPLSSGLAASDERYVPYLKFAQKNGLPCLFHSQVNVDNNTGACLKDNLNPSDPELIYKSAKKAPKTPVILGHMGAGWGESHSKAVDVMLKSIERGDANLYADISWVDFRNPEKPNLVAAIKRLMNTSKGDKTDRLLFGTDAPIAEYSREDGLYARVVHDTKEAIRKNFGEKSEELIEKIFYKNADNLFFQPKPKRGISRTGWAAIGIAAMTILYSGCLALKGKILADSEKNSHIG